MKHGLALFTCALLTSIAFAGDGLDLTRQAPFPSPRHSGAGRIAFSANNVQLLGWKTVFDFDGGNQSANDCWGYTSPSGREYALLGMTAGTGFVEVTDPGDPVIVAFVAHPPTAVDSMWRCIKTYQHYAYSGSEGGGGIQIFDLANIDSGTVTSSSITGSSCTTSTHTLALDEVSGFLYRCGGISSCGDQGLEIYSLADPASPAHVGAWNTGRYVHEAQVVTWDLPGPYLGRQIAFCFSQNNSSGNVARLQILDVTNKAAITLIATKGYTGGLFSHQGWLSTDKLHLYLNDEFDDDSFGLSRTRIFDVADLAAPNYLGYFSSGASSTDHNLYVKGNRIYEGNYRSGLRVFDDTNPLAPVEIAYFDTYPESDATDFHSLWSNYPYFASGTILGGDLEKGLFVWRLGPPKLTFDFPGGAPEILGPSGSQVQFSVSENTPGDLAPHSVRFHYSTGGAFTTLKPTPLGGGVYEVTMPYAPCGEWLQYYVSGKSSDGVTWTSPPAAPTQAYGASGAYGETVLQLDDLELDNGWLVNEPDDLTGFSTATTGTWTRVDPIGTAAQPEDDHTDAPGTLCWVTGQGVANGANGEADVDGGATALRSPVIDASGLADPYISYWRWFSNHAGSNGGTMTLTVDLSNDGGASWIPLETVGPTGRDTFGGWIKHSAHIADFLLPTSAMRLRFRAADTLGAIVEAAVDDVQIGALDCDPRAVTLSSLATTSGPFDGGNVVTLSGGGFQTGMTVSFGPNQASVVSVLSPTTLQVRVPRAPGPLSAKAGALDLRVDVTVQNTSSATLRNAYTYTMKQKNP